MTIPVTARYSTEAPVRAAGRDEGGFAYSGVEDALLLLTKAIGDAGYQPGIEASLTIAAAANGWTGKYDRLPETKRERNES
jgi:enolase